MTPQEKTVTEATVKKKDQRAIARRFVFTEQLSSFVGPSLIGAAIAYIFTLYPLLGTFIVNLYIVAKSLIMEFLPIISDKVSLKKAYSFYHKSNIVAAMLLYISFIINDTLFIASYFIYMLLSQLIETLINTKIDGIISFCYGDNKGIITAIKQKKKLVSFRGLLMSSAIAAVVIGIYTKDTYPIILITIMIIGMLLESSYSLYIYYKYLIDKDLDQFEKDDKKKKEKIKRSKLKRIRNITKKYF